MHSWGFALREGVFAKPKEIYFKTQKEREEVAMKRAGTAASWSYRAPEHRDFFGGIFNGKLVFNFPGTRWANGLIRPSHVQINKSLV